MSSAGGDGDGDGGVTSGDPRQYFCHQCDRTVSVSPSPSTDLLCPDCNGGFLEELEIPNPNPNPPNPFFSDFPLAGATSFPLVLPGTASPFDDLSALFGARSDAATGDAFEPLVFLQNYFQTLRAGGANLQLVIESGDPAGALRFPGNATHGDYFFGPGLEELIQHLAENDPNRYGTPPASKSAVEGLPDVTVTEELLASDSAQCAVCKDTFGLGETAKQMPCKHIYHADCILPWLELHNSCPVCRYELPTDDPDYEQRARRGGGSSGGGVAGGPAPQVNWNLAGGSADLAGGSGGSGGGGGDNLQRRRFRVSMPWPFRQLVSSAAETSNVGNANNDSNNNNSSNTNSGDNGRQLNSGNRGNQNFESETRQEDLD
ncbi:E3 ubiquitin-protein ligase RING1-like [Cajanus cajan]|uniref:RING-type E3 ubiquitin transferase n=1 Tax=Cajanus cajan TaxID=3821 RepID=A0A151TWL1_CAJCA|nr:E3 ubiquitin-protein ligase RING1-like [Cajanus cajan]KYP71408.1 E3 ubiquitin-protein ligase rnf181 family [Cajanus cajan]